VLVKVRVGVRVLVDDGVGVIEGVKVAESSAIAVWVALSRVA
jgi:hypothetical protein